MRQPTIAAEENKMKVVEINLLDGQGVIEIVVYDFMQETRLRSYMADADKAFANEDKLAEAVRWLEANQPDVFKRGIWDAINAA
jgi:hypothetical protein